VTPLTNMKTTTSKSLFGNNNLSGLIGSGVESMNKKNVYTNNNINKKQQSTTYSTIDSRKYIKTENGLVYTAINGTSIQNGNKSSDALVVDDYDIDDIDDDEIDSNNDENHHYHYADEDTDFSRANRNKNNNNNNNNSYGNSIKLKTIQQNQNFKNELNQRLKSINNKTENKTPEPTSLNQNDMLYSKNYSSSKLNTNNKPNNLAVQLNSNGTTNENSSTVTTSVSSASSCSSNCDLNVNTSAKQKLTSLNNANIDKNKNYSLLKTTLNGNSSSNTEIINETNKSQTKLNENNLTNGTNKPPILKPKPRTNNNNYQTNPNFKKQLNSTSDSLHNQSNDPLLLLKETSLQTTPSTSVTDVSSNNCTPQHYNSNLIDDITPVVNNNNQNKFIKHKGTNNNNNQMPRSRSNSLTRSNNKLNGQQSQQNLNKPNSNKVLTNGYSTLNSNKSLNNSNGGQTTVLKTFTNGNNISLYERINNTNMASIDDEINMTKAKQSNGNLMQQRTLERRVVKNSEC
jgi:hypothetical protein